MAVQTAIKRLKFAKLNPSATAEKITEMTGGVEFKLSNDALEASFDAGTFKGIRSLPGDEPDLFNSANDDLSTVGARATWLENTTLKVAVESLIDTHFHKTKGTDYNCATFMEEPALSKFKPAQIANVLKEFINGDNHKAWSIRSNATDTNFDDPSSWHSMYRVTEPQLAALASLAVTPLWPWADPLSLLSQRLHSTAATGCAMTPTCNRVPRWDQITCDAGWAMPAHLLLAEHVTVD